MKDSEFRLLKRTGMGMGSGMVRQLEVEGGVALEWCLGLHTGSHFCRRIGARLFHC